VSPRPSQCHDHDDAKHEFGVWGGVDELEKILLSKGIFVQQVRETINPLLSSPSLPCPTRIPPLYAPLRHRITDKCKFAIVSNRFNEHKVEHGPHAGMKSHADWMTAAHASTPHPQQTCDLPMYLVTLFTNLLDPAFMPLQKDHGCTIVTEDDLVKMLQG